MRIRRLLAGGGVALASVGLTGMLMVGPAGADGTTCSTATTNPSGTYTCTAPPTSTEPSQTPPTSTPPTTPTTPGSQGLPFTAADGGVAGGSSLPFTGADFAEIGAVGMGALALGGILTRRSRRRKAST